VFAWSVGEGFLTSFVLFFIPYGALHDQIRPDGLDASDHHSFGVTVASILIVVVTIRVSWLNLPNNEKGFNSVGLLWL
jgi:phospholipid-translocating ATPase